MTKLLCYFCFLDWINSIYCFSLLLSKFSSFAIPVLAILYLSLLSLHLALLSLHIALLSQYLSLLSLYLSLLSLYLAMLYLNLCFHPYINLCNPFSMFSIPTSIFIIPVSIVSISIFWRMYFSHLSYGWNLRYLWCEGLWSGRLSVRLFTCPVYLERSVWMRVVVFASTIMREKNPISHWILLLTLKTNVMQTGILMRRTKSCETNVNERLWSLDLVHGSLP